MVECPHEWINQTYFSETGTFHAVCTICKAEAQRLFDTINNDWKTKITKPGRALKEPKRPWEVFEKEYFQVFDEYHQYARRYEFLMSEYVGSDDFYGLSTEIIQSFGGLIAYEVHERVVKLRKLFLEMQKYNLDDSPKLKKMQEFAKEVLLRQKSDSQDPTK